MVILVGEAVQRLRDNDAGLMKFMRLEGGKGHLISKAEAREQGQALAVNTTLLKLDLSGNSLAADRGRATGQALTFNTTLTQLNLGDIVLWEGRAIGHALGINTILTALNLKWNSLKEGAGRAIGQALALNTTPTQLDLAYNELEEAAGVCGGSHTFTQVGTSFSFR
jgi:hypothetical protein